MPRFDLQAIVDRTAPNRRTFLIGSGVATTVALSGCMTALDFLFDPEDVTVGNNTDQQIQGSITIDDPTGERVLEEQYELDPLDGDDDSVDYEDLLTETGEYTISVEMGPEYSIGGNGQIERDIELTDVDEEGLLVVFGPDNVDDSIVVAVIENISDIEEFTDF